MTGFAIVLSIGGALAGLAMIFFLRTMSFIRSGQRVTGTVINIIETKDSDGDTSYTPVFEFNTLTQGKQQVKHNVAAGPNTWKLGENAIVIYDANNPKKAFVSSYMGLFGWTVFIGALAAPFLFVGGGYFVAYWLFIPTS